MPSSATTRKITPEGMFFALFPDRAIPPHLNDWIKLFNGPEYEASSCSNKEKVSLSDIVGSCHSKYGNRITWLQMMAYSKHLYVSTENYLAILQHNQEAICLTRISGTSTYYIERGNQQITARKIAGYKYITCSVTTAVPKAGNLNSGVVSFSKVGKRLLSLDRLLNIFTVMAGFRHPPAA